MFFRAQARCDEPSVDAQYLPVPGAGGSARPRSGRYAVEGGSLSPTQ